MSGLIEVNHDPNDGHVQSISLNAIITSLTANYEGGPEHDLTPPAQFDGLITGNLVDGLGGRNIQSIELAGPVGAELVYADNPGGSTESSANVGDVQNVGLLEDFGARGLESLTVRGPVEAQALWGADAGASPTSSADTNVGGITLLEGPGGGGLESISTTAPFETGIVFGESTDDGSISFPIEAGQDPVHTSLLDNFGDRGIQDLNIGGIEGIGGIGGLLGGGEQGSGLDLGGVLSLADATELNSLLGVVLRVVDQLGLDGLDLGGLDLGNLGLGGLDLGGLDLGGILDTSSLGLGGLDLGGILDTSNLGLPVVGDLPLLDMLHV